MRVSQKHYFKLRHKKIILVKHSYIVFAVKFIIDKNGNIKFNRKKEVGIFGQF